MSSLRELQSLCYRAFLLEESAPLAAELSDTAAIPNSARIAVYQNNARETFRKTLARVYPVIERLVGDDCFRGLAHGYMLDHPSVSGDLQRFGAAFADHLAAHYDATEFAYLPAVARLEWAIEEVLLEPEPEPRSLEHLAGVDPERFGELVFTPAPGVRFVGSRYPILTIWSANQPGRQPAVDLERDGEQVAVKRAGTDATMRRLDGATFALATALATGATLERASARAELDLEAALRLLVGGGYLGAPEIAPTT